MPGVTFSSAEPSCGKPWSFVRVHGYELEGFDGQVARNIPSKEECQAACLRMQAPPTSTGSATSPSQCRSAEYVPRERLCRMSSDNRRTQLRSFRAASPDVIYMENQCASGESIFLSSFPIQQTFPFDNGKTLNVPVTAATGPVKINRKITGRCQSSSLLLTGMANFSPAAVSNSTTTIRCQ